MRFASWTVCMRDRGLAAPRSGREGAAAFGLSMTCEMGRPTLGAAGFATGAGLAACPARPAMAEAGLLDAAEGLGAGALDLAVMTGAVGAALTDATGAGRAAGGGAWPYLLLLRLTIIFWGAFALGNASLLVGLVSFLGSRRAALLGLVVGRRLLGAGVDILSG
jgi:hypothetical protein